MKPHPRIRKSIKWGGAALTVLLVVVWIGSGWRMIQMNVLPRTALGVADGCLLITQLPPRAPTWWGRNIWLEPNIYGPEVPSILDFTPPSYRFHISWWFSQGRLGNGFSHRFIPLWLPATLSLLITALAFRLDTLARRRARGGVNLCPKCHYDRTGLAGDAVCPECGTGSGTA